MLPKIEQSNNWSPDELNSRTCSVQSQPKGAEGEELGDILLEETGQTQTVVYKWYMLMVQLLSQQTEMLLLVVRKYCVLLCHK